MKRSRMRRVRYSDPVPPGVRAALAQRSGGLCERCRQERATQAHHKTKRSQGGQHTAANLVHLCGRCHDWAEAHPSEATEAGWSIQANKIAAGVA